MSWESVKTRIAEVIKTNGQQSITGYLLQQELFRAIDEALAQGVISSVDITESLRKSLTPSHYTSYLAEGADYTTPAITPSTLTKVKIPTTVKSYRDFAVVDKGGGDYAVQYQGSAQRKFKIFMTTGLKSSTNNVTFNIYMYRNGIKEPGVGMPVKIGTGSDVGALSVVGEFTANHDDFLEVYVSVDLACSITFVRTSIVFSEI